MNHYLPIKRLEYIITRACTSRCRHCSVGDVKDPAAHLLPDAAECAVRELSACTKLESVMTFGGEPLLFPETTLAVHRAALELGIQKRQIITNGYFSRDPAHIREVADELRGCVNSLLLSVDGFHAEHIPPERVYPFAEYIAGLPGVRLHPAWLVSPEDDNVWNRRTQEVLAYFKPLGMPVSKGNVIFPGGRAERELAEYFPQASSPDLTLPCGEAPYTDPLDRVTSLSIDPYGGVYACALKIGKISEGMAAVCERYNPYANPYAAALMRGGVRELVEYARSVGLTIDPSAYRTGCGVCRALLAKLGGRE